MFAFYTVSRYVLSVSFDALRVNNAVFGHNNFKSSRNCIDISLGTEANITLCVTISMCIKIQRWLAIEKQSKYISLNS